MTAIAMDIAKMVEMLPESEQRLAHEVLKRLVLAWDPDFEKVTPEEATRIAVAADCWSSPAASIGSTRRSSWIFIANGCKKNWLANYR